MQLIISEVKNLKIDKMEKIREIKNWFLACAIFSFLLWHMSTFGYGNWYVKNINRDIGGIYAAILFIGWIIIVARILARVVIVLFRKTVIEMKSFTTNRGFTLITFRDQRGVECSLQKSSAANYNCIWLGTPNNRMHLTQDQVRELLPLLQHFVDTGKLSNGFDNEVTK